LIVFADQHHDSENSFLITPHLEQSSMSLQALRVAEYIAANSSSPDVNIILDKPTAKIYVMVGRLLLDQSVFLMGAKVADEFPGGSMAASYSLKIPLAEKKVTPAGKFKLVKTLRDPDYGTSLTFALYRDYRLAIHRIYLGNPEEKRQQRLDSKTTKDNSISYGCVNVSNTFYDQVLDRLEINSNSYVYIIPTNLDLLDKLLPLNSSLQ
jgi:hypothetical protein